MNRSCPCLRSLWERMFTREKASDGLERKVSSGRIKQDSDDDGDPEQRYNSSPSARAPAADSDVYMAQWAFHARDTDELSFDAGDRFHVVKRAGDWWTVDKLDTSGRVLVTGVVPHNYLSRAELDVPQP